LLGEVKWGARPFDRRTLGSALHALADKPPPPLPPRLEGAQLVRAIFVPEVARRTRVSSKELEGLMLITAADLLGLQGAAT
jgi:hypothetical protein